MKAHINKIAHHPATTCWDFPSPKGRELKFFETPIDESVFIKRSPAAKDGTRFGEDIGGVYLIE